MKIVAAIYILILAGIVFPADTNDTNYFSFLAYLPFGNKFGHFCLMEVFSFIINPALRTRAVQIRKLNFLFGSLIVFAVISI